ncbi:MAG: ferrous iron transport protein B [Imperialibacter sp.]|uniref:ferrous iron transport protein B n=1 Tax=Imperialibacter sp. TaxID=2038411 RepID=UPI003A88E9EC
MPDSHKVKVALVGNPNAGKSSLFNYLTGLNQKIGNFPGVTVDKRVGKAHLPNGQAIEVLDLPGTYSIYPRSMDEQVVVDTLLNENAADYPDVVIVIVDASNLKRNLLLFTEVHDLGIPVILALNMMDVASQKGLDINATALSRVLEVPVVSINARTGAGLDRLKNALTIPLGPVTPPLYDVLALAPEAIEETKEKLELDHNYKAYQYLINSPTLPSLNGDGESIAKHIIQKHDLEVRVIQAHETLERYSMIDGILAKVLSRKPTQEQRQFSNKLDRVLTHKVWGYLIFFLVLFLMFQSIFAWAEPMMDFIDLTFSALSDFVGSVLPDGILNRLITEGILPGIGGIVVFIPQIAFLFAFIAILEESGYMARAVFLMDKIMRKFGLNGKSVVPLISGVACAIPAVMATRNIDNWKDRIVTIMVTPLMSCSARLPVYTILIALVVPSTSVLGFFSLQGVALMGMYLLGFIAALLSAYVMKLIMKMKERSFFLMELPIYRMPRWKNVGITIVEKVKTFVFEAGKVILAISIVLWVLASYGPGDALTKAEETVQQESAHLNLSEEEMDDRVASYKLEHSYAGYLGKVTEPVIAPLGYDWKIGIALITSFAAREVFVGTIATIYSVGSAGEDNTTIRQRLEKEKNPKTGGPMFTTAVAFSLLVFYAFAMQCMSTIAIVYRETKGWKWPAIQLFYMSALAYLSALAVYNLLS